MTREQMDAIGEAMEQDRRASHEVEIAMQAEREMAERQAERQQVAEYHCTVEGCSGDFSRPWSCCDNCLVVQRLSRDLTDALDQVARFGRGDQVRRVERVRQAASRALPEVIR